MSKSKRKQPAKRPIFYKYCNDGRVEPIDGSEWLQWCEETNGGKGYLLGSGSAELSVDTIFLGIDRQLRSDGPPLLFETIIVGGLYNGRAWLSATYDEAKQRHQEACDLIGFEPPPKLYLTR
jgi:hypothetical protein